jgi:hypothetical protein
MSANKKAAVSLGSNPSEILNAWKKSVAADKQERHVISGRVQGGFTYCFADGGSGLELAVRLDAGSITKQASPEEKLAAVEALSNGTMKIESYDRVKGKYEILHTDDGVKLRVDGAALGR